ncbi:MAG: hypothetical protein MSA32_03270 [Bacteroidales bacterium]|nr:hypothetical protein [Bacteroidales bacterium]
MRRMKAIPTRHGRKMPHTNRQNGRHRAGWTASGRMGGIGQDGRLFPSLPPYINEQTRDNTSGKLQQ